MASLAHVLRSTVNPRTWLHGIRLAHFSSYSHVRQVGQLRRGEGVTMAPNVSFRNAGRISIGAGSHLGEYCTIWAGDSTGTVTLGTKCLLAPGVVITASNYGIARGTPVMEQQKIERDIVIGSDVWLGANVVVTAGVTIGDGVVVGAGAVVTRDLPDNCIAGGVPAKIIGYRPEPESSR